MRVFERIGSEKLGGKRLDQFLIASGIGASRSQVTRLIDAGSVLVNGKPSKPSYKVKAGDSIAATMSSPAPFEVKAEEIPLSVIYEDDDVIVIDKPVNMVVHPSRGHSEHTLVNALLHHCRDLPVGAGGKIRPGVLHRLDKDTTGLIALAKSDSSLTNLGRQIEARKLKREYLTIVWGDLSMRNAECGMRNDGWVTIDAPVGRSTLDRKRMAVTPFASRAAITNFEVLERFGIATLVRVRLETGRTHQIRVHMTHYGHPVVGDPEYGGRSRDVIHRQSDVPVFEQMLRLISRQALHAARLGFFHPVSGRFVEFASPLPEDFQRLLNYLRTTKDRGQTTKGGSLGV